MKEIKDMEPMKAPEEAKKKPGRKPKEQEPIALEIVCNVKDKEQAIEDAYSENMEANGTVVLRNPICGGSMQIKDLQFFPRVNRKCTCGKVGHYMFTK